MKASRAIVALVVLLLLGGAAYAWYPPFRVLVLTAAGRSRVCSFSDALRSHENMSGLIAIKDRILQASHLVEEKDGLELWETPKGRFWIPRGNRYVLPFNLAELERHVYGSGKVFVQPGDVVLDCGASDGDFTLEALHAGAKMVVSVEIAPSNIECLRRTLAPQIAEGRVIVYPKGVWDKDDFLTLNTEDTNFAANSVVMRPEGARTSVRVPLTTIDQIVAELKLPRVDFIKMDVEGAEARALRGARDTITRFRPRLAIAMEHNEDDEIDLPKVVHEVRADYQVMCGPCLEADKRIRADVLNFY
jgi:FkbM family methyltransferase